MKIISIIVSLIICVSGYALTLGKIDVLSGLDQKLSASMGVDFLPDGQKIAWQVTADAMGKTLNGLRYRLEKNGEDTNLIISTDQPIHLPVITLNVLAKINNKQVAAEEFTILLDPVAKPIPMDVKKYGPVSKSESLDEIANKVRPSYITMDNASNTLFYANPQAFENNDSARLIPGSFLIIPKFSEGISAVGANSISNAKIIKIEEQLGLIVNQITSNNTTSEKKYTELSQYALNLEQLVVTLASRMTAIESGTSFLVEDITKQAKVQQIAMNNISVQLQENHQMVLELQAKSELWLYIGLGILVILILIALAVWLRKRRQNEDGDEDGDEVLDPEDNMDDDFAIQPEDQNDTDESEVIESSLSDDIEVDVDQDSPEDLENIDSSIIDKSSGIDSDDETQIEINEKEDDIEDCESHFLNENDNKNIMFMSQDDDKEFKDSASKVEVRMFYDDDDDELEQYRSDNSEEDEDKIIDGDIDNAIVVNKSKEVEDLFEGQNTDSVKLDENEYDISAEDNSKSLTDLEQELKEQSKLESETDKASNDVNSDCLASNDKENKESKSKDGGLSLTPLDLNKDK